MEITVYNKDKVKHGITTIHNDNKLALTITRYRTGGGVPITIRTSIPADSTVLQFNIKVNNIIGFDSEMYALIAENY